MMRPRCWNILYAGAVLALALAGCKGAQVKQQPKDSGFASPRFDFRGIQFANPSFTGMKLAFRFELAAADGRPAKVVSCPYKVELEGLDPIEGTENPQGEVAGEGKLMVTTTVAIPWPKTHDDVMAFLGRRQIRYNFSETCNLEGPEGGLTVSAGDTGMVPLPRLPQMTVTGANAQRFGADEAKLTFELSILNENTFPVRVDRIVYKITLDGKPLVEGELPVSEGIPANNETTFDIPTEVRSGEASKGILDLLKRTTIPYLIEGSVHMGDFEIPVKGDGTITFSH